MFATVVCVKQGDLHGGETHKGPGSGFIKGAPLLHGFVEPAFGIVALIVMFPVLKSAKKLKEKSRNRDYNLMDQRSWRFRHCFNNLAADHIKVHKLHASDFSRD